MLWYALTPRKSLIAFTRFLYMRARPQKSYTRNQWSHGGNICLQTKLPLKWSRAYDFIYGTKLRLDSICYSNINFPTRCNLCSDSLNKSAGLVSSFVDTTKIFCKLSGTLCQFNCLETLIFFEKLSTIRILFCSNDECTLSIILKTNMCDICIIKSSKK